ncbi:hypothetical protein FACS1894193_00970 [Bacilli bacterium]|nr:hypothetical protein FACS1894193_00970 [Bacilli bacterium]
MRIAIIDSGIGKKIDTNSNVKEAYRLEKKGSQCFLISEESIDLLGHGTAISEIIVSENPEVELISIRIYEKFLEVDEESLFFVLEYINNNIEVDIINISAGITYLSNYERLNEICNKLHKNGIIVISAFDNNGAISFPAAFENVLGIDVENRKGKNGIIDINHSIVNLVVDDRYYRTLWNQTPTIIKGTSFACAYVTGILSKYICDHSEEKAVLSLKKTLAVEKREIKKSESFPKPNFEIKKAIVFPINKESKSFLRFRNQLKFEVVGLYDEKILGKIGQEISSLKIKSYDDIEWTEDFDTIILSYSKDIASLTGREYQAEILENARKHNKNIYSFEKIFSDRSNVFYPTLTNDMVPFYNISKLHKTTIPVVGVFGTSSKQGKFTLQQHIISRINEIGYRTGFISTEPSGYLLDADFVFHYGYSAELSLDLRDYISILNEMVWKIQLKNKDIIISGAQSGIQNYNDSRVTDFNLEQQSILLGLNPDFSILCVNPHDELEYIKKSINYINSICNSDVKAIVVFPVKAEKTITGLGYITKELCQEKIESIKRSLTTQLGLPTFAISQKKDMDKIVEFIVEDLSEG